MSKKFKPPLILVDGSSYLHRAYHALPPLTNSKGEPTGAVFGVINMLKKLIREYQPSHIAVVFDSKEKTFRHKIYPAYKANRPPMPEDLRIQVKPLYDLIHALGLPLLVIDGVEADDVIGTLTTQAQKEGMSVLISTGDKDFAQLVNERVTLINTMNNVILDSEGVEKKFGVPPERIIDYLTLVGDTSDNIPGVEKVGPKTAVKWLKEYGSLNRIIEHSDEIKGKVGEYLRNAIDQIPLSQELVTIVCDVALETKPRELVDQPDDIQQLSSLLEQLEFKSWLTEIKSPTPGLSQTEAVIPAPPAVMPAKARIHIPEKLHKNYRTILNEKDFEDLLSQLKKTKLFAFDSETTSLDYMQTQIVGLSFSFEPEQGIYLPLAHDYENAPQQINREKALESLKPILEDKKIKKLGQNLKYDKEVLLNHAIELNGIEFDTMLESYVFDSSTTRHNMDTLAEKYLDIRTIHYEEVAGKGVKQMTFNQVLIETASPYAAEDADIAFRLHQFFWPKIESTPSAKDVFRNIEMPLLEVLVTMERQGVLVDTAILQKQSYDLEKRLLNLEQETHEIAGTTFNISSPKQLQEVLYDQLKLPVLKKTPTGQPSTAENVLQTLALDYPLPNLILEYRSLSKLKTTYTDRLPEQVDATTGRVHTSYHQAVTSTGRLSSTNPNLQNIPIRTKDGRQIRQAFIAPKNYKILSADYSQIELRIMAHLSQDQGLLNAFQNDLDIHRATASEIFNVPLELITQIQRRKAKAINFGLIYGMSAFGLAQQIGVDRHTAQLYIDAYFEKYPKVSAFMEHTRDFAHQHGYVETLHGRRLYTPNINARNIQIRNAAERAAINAPMQGTSAEIIKIAMIHLHEWIQKSKNDVRMTMQVHDELVFEIHQNELTTAENKIKQLMIQAAQLTIPLVVDIGIGNNWDEAH